MMFGYAFVILGLAGATATTLVTCLMIDIWDRRGRF